MRQPSGPAEGAAGEALAANLRCLLSLPAEEHRAGWERELAALGERPRASADGAPLWARRGKLLSNLERRPEARAALDKALALDGSCPEALLWSGELSLLEGDGAAALPRLEAAVRLRPAWFWARWFCAAGRLAAGEPAAAAKDLARARGLARGHESLAAGVLAALAAASASRHDEGLAALEPVVAAAGERAWPHLLRARLLAAKGEQGRAVLDLGAALEREPSAPVYLERSRLHEELGDLAAALSDCERAEALAGKSPELLMRRAHLQVCRRHYHLAVPEYSGALELAPRHLGALLGRATVHCIRGDMDAAVSDLARARKASRGEPRVALEELRMRVYAGRLQGVAREAAALARRAPELAREAGFLQGCLRLKERRYREAAEALGAVLSPGRETDFDWKAGFYQAASLGLAALGGPLREPPPAGRARLLICGLGIRPPFTASLEVLQAIHSSDLVFNNLSEPEIAGLISLLSERWLPTMFDVRGADSRWTKTIFRHLEPGQTVSFVTRGHPMVCGGLACSLIRECRRTGTEYRVLTAVSSMNTLAARARPAGDEDFWGQQVLDYSSVFAPEFTLETRLPAVIYFNSTVQVLPREDFERFCGALEAVYSARQACLFYGRSFTVEPEPIPLSRLRGFYGSMDSSFTLLLPPKGGGF